MKRIVIACVTLALSCVEAHPRESRKDPNSPPKFNAHDQYLSVEGEHAFVAPGPNDARGPCPGLNAMANHGYLPHNGFATVSQFIEACTTVFRMGDDLASLLAVYGAALDGPGVGWSIAGTPRFGIGGSHNNYESDNSPLRGDLHQYGSNSDLVMSQFHELYKLQPHAESANYDLEVLRQFRYIRYEESIAKNPVFYFGPFSGAIVTQAAYTFIYRFMSNKSAENPMGLLNKQVLKDFMSIKGPENNLKWVRGHERIPYNWYTRNKEDAYTIKFFTDDIGYITQKHPEMGQSGCNRGKVNSYSRMNTSAMSNGGESAGSKGAVNPSCLGLSFALTTAETLGVSNSALRKAMKSAGNTLGCKVDSNLDLADAKRCPGFSLYGGPKGKVARGAIQN